MSNNIVYADGVFDLLHIGHINFFKNIKQKGDMLIIGVISDENANTYKREPIIKLYDRVKLLESIDIVDKVIADCPFNSITPEFIKKNSITKIYYAGHENTWNNHYAIPIKMGIMRYINYSTYNLSTSKIINTVLERYKNTITTDI